MTMSDPIADMLTRIRNANTAKHDTVDVPSSKMKLAIAQILLDEGYIKAFDVVEDGSFKTIHITLKYGVDKNEKVITGLRRISKPGLRVYAGSADVPKVFGGLGTAIISTNQGEPLVGSDCLAGKAFANICHRILGEEVPFLDLEIKSSVWGKLKEIFKKN